MYVKAVPQCHKPTLIHPAVGSFGKVYKAVDKTTGEVVAIKQVYISCLLHYLQYANCIPD
jgi:hypothetical protein